MAGQIGSTKLQLRLTGRAAEEQQISSTNLRVDVLRLFEHDALCKGAGLMLDKRTVKHKKLLQCGRGRLATGTVGGSVGKIMQTQHVVGLFAIDAAVDGPATVVKVGQTRGSTAD